MTCLLVRVTRHTALILLWIVSLSSFGAVPRISIAPKPDWLLPAKPGGHPTNARDVSDGYYLSFIDVQHHVEKQAVYLRLVREILSSAGVQNGSELTIYLNPAYEQLTVHEVTHYRNGKPQNKLRPNAFRLIPVESERERFLYNDTYTASLVLDDVRPGDRIEYAYTLTGRNPVFNDRFAADLYFTASDPLPHYHRALIARSSRPLTFREFNKPPTRTISKQGDLTIHEWNAYDLKPNRPEESEPDWNDTAPFVQVSEYGSWKAVTDWALPLYAMPEASGLMKQKIAEWQGIAGNNPSRYAQLAVAFLQDDIRYLGVEIGQHSHRPHAPVQTMQQRYGDCKDKSILLCALLRANKINAWPALTSSYNGSRTKQFLPSPNVFNHVIVCAELNGKSIWIDPTIAYQRNPISEFYIPPYGSALLIRSGEASLSVPGPINSGKQTITETFRVPDPGSNELGSLNVTSVYTRNQADDVRANFASRGVQSMEKDYLTYYQNNYRKQEVNSVSPVALQDDSLQNVLTVTEAYELRNVWQSDSSTGERTFFVFGKTLFDMLLRLPNTERRQPVALGYPNDLDYRMVLRLPAPWTLSDNEWSVNRNAYRIDVKQTYSDTDSTLTLFYHYETKANSIPASEVAQYRADVERLTTDLEFGLSHDPNFASESSQINYWSVLLGLLALLGGAWAGVRLYQYDPPMHEQVSWAGPGVGPWFPNVPIGGWLFLIAFGILTAPLYRLVTLTTNGNFFADSLWSVLKSKDSDYWFPIWQTISAIELAMNILLLLASVLLVFLFVQRRRLFPLAFALTMLTQFLFLLSDDLTISALSNEAVSSEDWGDLVKILIAILIWVPYLYNSRRSGRTFVHRYAPESEPVNSVV